MSESENMHLSPLNPISGVVLVIVFAIIAIEVVLQLAEAGWIGGPAGVGWRLEAATHFGIRDSALEYLRQNYWVWPEVIWEQPNLIWPFLTFPFIHAGAGHVALGAALMLVMGKTIAEEFSSFAVVALFLGCSISGAIVYGLVYDGPAALLGIYPVMYGFIAAYTWSEASKLHQAGKSMMPAFRIIAMLFAFRTVFSLIFGLRTSWPADLTGLIVGFLLSFVLAPDGRARIGRWVAAIRGR